LEEGMAAHFSSLIWRIPWTEESSRLQSVGSQKMSDTPEHAQQQQEDRRPGSC